MSRLKDYTIIEQAIQIAYYWILGWVAAKECLSDEDRHIIEQRIKKELDERANNGGVV